MFFLSLTSACSLARTSRVSGATREVGALVGVASTALAGVSAFFVESRAMVLPIFLIGVAGESMKRFVGGDGESAGERTVGLGVGLASGIAGSSSNSNSLSSSSEASVCERLYLHSNWHCTATSSNPAATSGLVAESQTNSNRSPWSPLKSRHARIVSPVSLRSTLSRRSSSSKKTLSSLSDAATPPPSCASSSSSSASPSS
jgi:hypothetical protein